MRRQLLVLAPVLVMALWASWHVVDETRPWVAQNADSAVYLGTADNLKAGHGPTVPFTMVWDEYGPRRAASFGSHIPSTHYPPGYPAALAATSVITGGTRHAARLLDVVFVAVNVMLVGVVAARMTGFRSVIAASVPPALCLFVNDLSSTRLEPFGWFGAHLSVASEPLFMAAFTVAVLAIAYVVVDRRRWPIVVAGVAAMIAIGTRYSGVALLVSGVIALLAFDHVRRWRARLFRSGVFVAIAALPTLLVVIVMSLQAGEGARPLSYHPIGGNAQRLVEELGRYLVPGSWTPWLRTWTLVVVIVLVVAGSIWMPGRAAERWRDDDHGRVLVWVALITVWAYADVVMASRAFFDAAVPIDARIIAPVRGIFLSAIVAVVYRWIAPYGATRATVVLATYAAVFVYAGWTAHNRWLENLPAPGPKTDVERALAALPKDAFVVTNSPDFAYAAAHRPSYILPSRVTYLTNEDNKQFDDQLAQWGDLLRRHNGYVFMQVAPFLTVANAADVQRHVPLHLISTLPGEDLYAVSSGP